jgi:hypothetical protein
MEAAVFITVPAVLPPALKYTACIRLIIPFLPARIPWIRALYLPWFSPFLLSFILSQEPPSEKSVEYGCPGFQPSEIFLFLLTALPQNGNLNSVV